MADITMCNDRKCPLKENCYRFMANADSHWQSWFTETPRKGDKCGVYWPIDEKKRVTKVKKGR